ncbi:MAG: PKD domain-containing protein [Candidatus Abawacabacteria bacterium]|nr:PKD domain-containing protein [Candidatus Abawacabacteria bacterium]
MDNDPSQDFPPSRKEAAQNQVKERFAVKETGARRTLRTPGEQNARRILVFIALGFILIFVIALFVAALSGSGNNLLSAFGLDTDIRALLSRVVNVVFGISFVVTIVLLVIGIFMQLAALGEPNQVRKARRLLIRSGVALIITAVLWIIFTILLGNVSLPQRKPIETGFKITTEPAMLTAPAPFSVKFATSNLALQGKFLQWDFGDGTTGTGPTLAHEFTQEGRFIVTVTATDAQGENVQASTVVVINNIRPQAIVTVDKSTGPAPLKVKFDGSASKDPNGQIVNQQWKFGDDSEPVNTLIAEHEYKKEGPYTAVLTLTDNNFDTTEFPITITVGPPLNAPVIKLSTNPPLVEVEGKKVIRGEKPLAVRFSAADSTDDGQIVSFDWEYGDGDQSESGKTVNHSFAQTGTYKITVRLKDDDNNVSEENIEVIVGNPKQGPQAAMITEPRAPERGSLEGVFPFQVSFNAETSRDPDGSIVAYEWDFGDNTEKVSGQRVTHTFTRAGTFSITLVVTDNDNQKSAPAMMSVQVKPPTLEKPIIQITSNPPTPSGNVPFTIAFDASGSRSSNGNIIAYEWDFGDGAKVIGNARISHTYNSPGVYTVSLTARDIANQTNTQTVVVAVRVAAPVAQIEASRSRGTAPLNILFNASGSTGSITDFQWNFDDGTTGLGRTVEHIFNQPGRYNVVLKVTDIAGQVDEATLQVTVE